MKRRIENCLLITCVTVLIVFCSCEDETDAPKSCIEPPCGAITSSATNLTLLIQNGLAIGNIGIVVDEVEQALSLDGRDLENSKPFTCWQTVPTILSTSTVVLIYEIDGEVIIGTLNVSGLMSSQLTIEIDEDAASIYDYEVCNDTP